MTAPAYSACLAACAEPVDTSGDGGLQCDWDGDIRPVVAAGIPRAVAFDYAALGEVPHDLAGEERVSGGSFGDPIDQAGD